MKLLGRHHGSFLALLSICLACAVSTAQASGLIRADGHYFKDQKGRVVLLRGVNVSNEAKVPPFQPLRSLADLQRIHDLGFNTLRLLFIWEAFEPEPGKYDFAYLDQLGAIVSRAADLGIYTIVDFHMDGFSRYTIGGCGSGAPAWTIYPGQNETPDNGNLCKMWSVIEAFEYIIPFSSYNDTLRAFYDDEYGARTHYLEVWTRIAHYFHQFPSVIGYDMLNEPWGFEPSQIAPLYEDSAVRIRAEDPEAVLFVEPEVLTAIGWAETLLPRPSFSNFAYAPHNYDPVALGMGLSLNGGLAVRVGLDVLENRAKDWNVPLFVGEYGAAGSGGAFLPELMKSYYKKYDHDFVSSAQWDYSSTWNPTTEDGWNRENLSIVDQDGKIRSNFIARAFPSAVAGTPIELSTDLDSGSVSSGMDFSWNNDPSLGATEFTIPVAATHERRLASYQSENSDLTCVMSADLQQLSCVSAVPGPHQVHINVQ